MYKQLRNRFAKLNLFSPLSRCYGKDLIARVLDEQSESAKRLFTIGSLLIISLAFLGCYTKIGYPPPMARTAQVEIRQPLARGGAKDEGSQDVESQTKAGEMDESAANVREETKPEESELGETDEEKPFVRRDDLDRRYRRDYDEREDDFDRYYEPDYDSYYYIDYGYPYYGWRWYGGYYDPFYWDGFYGSYYYPYYYHDDYDDSDVHHHYDDGPVYSLQSRREQARRGVRAQMSSTSRTRSDRGIRTSNEESSQASPRAVPSQLKRKRAREERSYDYLRSGRSNQRGVRASTRSSSNGTARSFQSEGNRYSRRAASPRASSARNRTSRPTEYRPTRYNQTRSAPRMRSSGRSRAFRSHQPQSYRSGSSNAYRSIRTSSYRMNRMRTFRGRERRHR